MNNMKKMMMMMTALLAVSLSYVRRQQHQEGLC